MLDKIAIGRLNKFFKENTLLSQTFIKDSKMSVSNYIASNTDNAKVLLSKEWDCLKLII